MVGHPPREAEQARELLRKSPEVELRDPGGGAVDVVLCAAGVPWRMVDLLEPLLALRREARRGEVVAYRAPAVLLDLLGEIGGRIAGLHGLHGYLLRECAPAQWLTCLEIAARRHRWAAPGPSTHEFYNAWTEGPLTPVEWNDLRLAGRGLIQEERARQLNVSLSTLDKSERVLKDRLEVDREWRVRALAAALGFCRYWPAPPPEAGP